MSLPWKKLSQKVLKTSSKKLIRKTYKLPNGKINDFDIYDEGIIVTIFALTTEKKVILTKQFRPGPEKIFLELPGGRVDKGENPRHAASRELLEETGYRGELKAIGPSIDRAYTTLVRYNFVALNCRKVAEQDLDDTEFIEVVEMDLKGFRKRLKTVKLKGIETAYLALDHLGLL